MQEVLFKQVDDNQKFIFLLVAHTMEPRKGFDIAVKAFKSLPPELRAKAELWCVGSTIPVYLQDYVRTVLNEVAGVPEIKCFELMSSDEILKLYEAADVIVSASREDPSPLVVVQGFMMKKVCILSTGCGVSYLIENGENGFIFKNEDIAELADRMRFCLEHEKELDEIGSRGRQIYDKYFRPAAFEKNFAEKLARLVGRKIPLNTKPGH